MNVYEDVDRILSGLRLPYYNGMPELTDYPNLYIVYDLYDIPVLFADDEETALEVSCTVTVVSHAPSPQVYEAVKTAMKSAGWTYQLSRDIANTQTYPSQMQHAMEFKKTYDLEDD